MRSQLNADTPPDLKVTALELPIGRLAGGGDDWVLLRLTADLVLVTDPNGACSVKDAADFTRPRTLLPVGTSITITT